MTDKTPVIVKKYGNRRLYDTSTSKYVNLDDIARMVREGKEVRVMDANTGEDLTRVTLTQIITENAKEQPTGLPLELLRELVLATDKAGQEVVMWYLRSAFETYQQMREAIQNRLEEVQASASSPMQMMRNLVPGPLFGSRESDAELKTLQERVAELEAQLKEANREGRQKRTKTKKPGSR